MGRTDSKIPLEAHGVGPLITPGPAGAFELPSNFLLLICTVADMAKGPFLGPPELPTLLLPKLEPPGLAALLLPKEEPPFEAAAGFLSAPSVLAAPRTPFEECRAAFASSARLFKVSGFRLQDVHLMSS